MSDVKMPIGEMQNPRIDTGTMFVQRTKHIDDLPHEIMDAIFLAGEDTARKDRHVTSYPFPICVSHVSRRWRWLAIHLPFLWRRVSICTSRPLCIPSMYLERSAPSTFDLSLRVSTFSAYGQLRGALNVLAPHISRVQDLSICLQLRFGMDVVLSEILTYLGTYSTPSLETLGLEATEIGRQTGGHAPRFMTRPNGRLTSLSLTTIPLNWDLSLFAGLSSLELRYDGPDGSLADGSPSLHDLRRIAQASPSLTSLVLRGSTVYPGDTTVKPIELPSLRSLSVSLEQGADYARQFFSALVAPELETLHLLSASQDALETLHEIVALPRKPHFPALTTLGFLRTPTSFIREFAQAMPGITTLIVTRPGVLDLCDFLDKGLAVESSMRLWPSLRDIFLDIVQGPEKAENVTVESSTLSSILQRYHEAGSSVALHPACRYWSAARNPY